MTPSELPAPYVGPPLRIAYVGNFRHPWCTERHVSDSLAILGHTVHCWQEDTLDWSTVMEKVRVLGVQLVMWTRTWPQELDIVQPVLSDLAAEGIASVSFHLDRWFGLDRAHQVDDQPFFRTSLVVSPDDSPKWAEHGVNHFWLPPGVYGPECEPVPPNPRRWPFDVVFVGSHPYPHPEWQKYRTDLLSAFRAAFGRRFAILPRERRGTPIRGRDLQELYATVPVVLGDSCLAGESTKYLSDRCPETLGRGGFLIHPFVKGMIGFGPDDWYLASKDLMGYQLGDYAEAVARARWALDHRDEARDIADHGRATVLARDTYAHRMGTVLAVAEGIYGGYRDVSKPIPRNADGHECFHCDGTNVCWRHREEVLACPTGHIFKGTVSESGKPCPAPGCGQPLQVSRESGGSDHLPKRPAGWKRASPEVEREAGVSFSKREVKGDSHPPVLARLNRWSARFDLRPGEVGEGEKIVIREVWDQDDYRAAGKPGLAGAVVVDIGANIGAFSVLAARAGARKVLAFEPDLSNYSRLTHHIAINRAATVEAVNAAVTDGSSPYVRMVGLSDGAHAEPSDDPNDIPTITLADIIGRLGKIDFIKIDVEGNEFSIIEAVPLELLSRVKRMALEWHAPVVTHLMHLRGDEFGPLVTKLAEAGRVETFGHPSRGGLIWWASY